MRNLFILILGLMVTSCAHRLELSPQYETYNETYKGDENPRLRDTGIVTSQEPDDSKQMEIEGVGYYIGITKKQDNWVARGSIGFVPFNDKEYTVEVGGVSSNVTLESYAGAIELAAGYEIIDTKVLVVRPELVLKEQMYFFDSGGNRPSSYDLVAHEHLGPALNIEIPFFTGALGFRAACMFALNDNPEIEKAHSVTGSVNLIFGSFKGGRSK